MLLKNQCKVLRQSSNVLSQGVTLLFFPKHDLLRISSSFLSWRSSEASGKQHRWTIEITYTHLSTRPHISNFAWISYAENFRKAHLPFSCPSIIVILVSTSEVLLGIVHPSARLTSRSYSSVYTLPLPFGFTFRWILEKTKASRLSLLTLPPLPLPLFKRLRHNIPLLHQILLQDLYRSLSLPS